MIITHWPSNIFNQFEVQIAVAFLLLGLSCCCHVAERLKLGGNISRSFFVDVSIRTPCWIGYFFKRSKMHRIRHQTDCYKNNDDNIVWWDRLFATYENRAALGELCGFNNEREERFGDILLFKRCAQGQEGLVRQVYQ